MSVLCANIAHLLWEPARQAASRAAIVERERSTSYEELGARAAAFAAALVARGIQPDDRVAIFLDRGPDAAAAFFGAAAAGAIVVNVNESLRPRQVEHILQHSGARVLLTSADLLVRQPRAFETAAEIVDVSEVPLAGDFVPVGRVSPDPVQIIYTSGSTGLPKGVTISHGNLWAGVTSVSSYVGITGEDRIASLLPFSFDYGFNQLLCALGSGAALIIERSTVPQHIVAALRSREVTVLPAVPPLWLQLLTISDFVERPLGQLRAMTNTGGRVPVDAVQRLRRAQPQADLFLMYGLTEAFRATYLPPTEADRRPDSIGRAIPGSQIMVLREDLTECAPGETGELVQRGPTVALGYWNDPETTGRVYRPNPLRPAGTPEAERVVFSGDLVTRDEEGFLYFVGRRDKMIKTLGYRVSPDEVVEVLHASGQLVEAAITTEEDEQRGTRIVAHVVLRPTGSLQRVDEFCRSEMPRYMQPARIVERTALPRTSSGKFDLVALQEGS